MSRYSFNSIHSIVLALLVGFTLPGIIWRVDIRIYTSFSKTNDKAIDMRTYKKAPGIKCYGKMSI